MSKIFKTILAVASLALPLQIHAASIPILNAGFENPTDDGSNPRAINDWTSSQANEAGIWNINQYPYGFWNVNAPEGNQIAFISVAPHVGVANTISQVLGATLSANSVYHLSGYVGHPLGYDTSDGTPTGTPTVYTVALWANGNLLNSLSGTGPAGSFTTFDLAFDSTGSAFVGQTLEIRLSSNQAQTGFDAIALSVPDGGMTAMLLGIGLLGLGWVRRMVK